MAEVGFNVDQKLEFMALGGGQEVGRSCLYLKYKGRTLLLDCGVHPGRDGIDSCPFFDSIDPEEIDIMLITHFHLDHCASLPYFTEKTNFKGRIFMTHATKAVMRLLVADSVKLSKGGLYDDQDLNNCISKIEVIDFHQTIEYKGIRFCAYAAGHVLGAAMFTIDIDGVNVLYTGDYSMEEDRHLSSAEIPMEKPDLLIVESTYGVQAHSSRVERETRFRNTVEDTVRRGGNCLIPVFALGRAQELLLILDEHWQSKPDLQSIPVFYASRLANKALRVYQTFVNMMNQRIRDLADVCNPFKFSYIQSFQQEFDAQGQCVVIASPGMLQSGCSRQLFEMWCENEKNSVVLAGYSVEGTLAKKLQSEPEEITCLDGRIKSRRCTIEYISFSAHVDYIQNSKFIRTVQPDNIILVHGEQSEMKRLKEELDREIATSWNVPHRPPVVMPRNCQKVTLSFSKSVKAEVLGSVSEKILSALNESADTADDSEEGSKRKFSTSVDDVILPPSTVLVRENFVSKVVSTQDMAQFTSCRLGRIRQRLHVPIPPGLGIKAGDGVALEILVPYLDEIFDSLDLFAVTTKCESGAGDSDAVNQQQQLAEILIQGLVSVTETVVPPGAANAAGVPGSVVVDWLASPMADVVADAVTSVVQQAISAPAIVISRMTTMNAPTSLMNPAVKKRFVLQKPIISEPITPVLGSSETESDSAMKKMKLAYVQSNKQNTEGHVVSKSNKDNVLKLRKLKSALIRSGQFSEVLLNTDGTSLIFRDASGDEALAEIIWDASAAEMRSHAKKHVHSAKVKCEDDKFRARVIGSLRAVDEMMSTVTDIE